MYCYCPATVCACRFYTDSLLCYELLPFSLPLALLMAAAIFSLLASGEAGRPLLPNPLVTFCSLQKKELDLHIR